MILNRLGFWTLKSPDEWIPALKSACRRKGPASIAVPVDYRRDVKLTKRLGNLDAVI